MLTLKNLKKQLMIYKKEVVIFNLKTQIKLYAYSDDVYDINM